MKGKVDGYWNKLDFHGHLQLNVACVFCLYLWSPD